jgi:hypothetical protein
VIPPPTITLREVFVSLRHYPAACGAADCHARRDRSCPVWVTLSYDAFARTLLTAENDITLPLEIAGMTDSVTAPRLYALGTLMTGFSFVLMLVPLLAARILARKR